MTTETKQPKVQQVQNVSIAGLQVLGASLDDGSVWVSIPSTSRTLGLREDKQITKLKGMGRAIKLKRLPLSVPIGPSSPPQLGGGNVPKVARGGGDHHHWCIRIDTVFGWLIGIRPSRVKQEYRATLEELQCELVQVMAEAFGVSAFSTDIVVPRAVLPRPDTITMGQFFRRTGLGWVEGHAFETLRREAALRSRELGRPVRAVSDLAHGTKLCYAVAALEEVFGVKMP